jgi:hypothetical protein
MDIEGGEKKLHQVDSFLTTLTKLLKKHWLILTIGLLGFGVYEIVNMPDPEVVYDESYAEAYNDSVYAYEDSIAYDDSVTTYDAE